MENPMMPWFFSLQSPNSGAVRFANQPSAESHCDVVDDFLYLCSGANVAFAKNAELRASAATAVARGVCPSNAYTTWPCGPDYYMFINNIYMALGEGVFEKSLEIAGKSSNGLAKMAKG